MKKKKTPKPKHTPEYWERKFIKEHGQELHAELVKDIPELRTFPEYWKSLVKLAPYFNPPATPRLRELTDRFFDKPFVENGRGTNEEA